MMLAGLRVLVTRPADQATSLIATLNDAGAVPVPFPVIRIGDPLQPDIAADRLSHLSDAGGPDLVIFVSANAVTRAVDYMLPQGIVAQPQMAAIGAATARAMRRESLSVDLLPSHGSDSESLLAMPELQQLEGKRVLIVRGNGGRNLLADTLEERGAQVCYAEVYRRELPDYPADRFAQLCRSPGINVATVTSNAALDNLCTLAGPSGLPQLLATPLVVASQRAVAVATRHGFHAGICVARGASDSALLDAIDGWQP